jgi:hypothetical protein
MCDMHWPNLHTARSQVQLCRRQGSRARRTRGPDWVAVRQYNASPAVRLALLVACPFLVALPAVALDLRVGEIQKDWHEGLGSLVRRADVYIGGGGSAAPEQLFCRI